MKKFFLGFFLFFLPCTLISADPVEGEQLFATLQLTPFETLRGKFKQEKVIPGLAKAQNAKGTFIIDKNRGMVWNIESPSSKRLHYLSTKQASSTTKSETQFGSQSNQMRARLAIMIGRLAQGNFAALGNDFRFDLEKLPDLRWNLRLTPRSSSASKFLERIDIHGGVWIDSIHLYDRRKVQTKIVLYNHVIGPEKLSQDEERWFVE